MSKLKYYKNLDGIRGIAVLLVMFGHFFMRMHSNYNFVEIVLRKISILGQLGVALFFVLSGFLITRILLYSKQKKNYFKNFYVRRILRIFPLYYLFLLLYFFVFPFIFNTEIVSFSQQVYYYSYLQNFALTFNWNAEGPTHFWSLAVEEQFYFFWPLLIYVFSEKKVMKIIIFIIISAIFLRHIFLTNSIEVYYFTFTRIDALAVGAILSLFEQKSIRYEISKKQYLLLIFIIFIPTFILWIFFGGEANYTLQVLKYFIFSFGFFAIIGYVTKLNTKHFINKFLTLKFLSYTGNISYGLYVYHILAIDLTNKYLRQEFWFMNFLITFSIAYIISSFSYYFFESRFLSLKKHFTNN